jgi:hypothetical protein
MLSNEQFRMLGPPPEVIARYEVPALSLAIALQFSIRGKQLEMLNA